MMTTDADCVFCKIMAGDIPSHRVLDTEDAYAFLDIAPLASGHTLLIPRRHARRMEDMTPDAAASLARHLPTLVQAIMSATGASGVNILQNNGSVAGQVVDHVHLHIVPRRDGDGLGFRWNAGTYAAGEAESLLERIAGYLETR